MHLDRNGYAIFSKNIPIQTEDDPTFPNAAIGKHLLPMEFPSQASQKQRK